MTLAELSKLVLAATPENKYTNKVTTRRETNRKKKRTETITENNDLTTCIGLDKLAIQF